MLSLSNRPCRIGSSINTRTEKHGDEDVTALDIPLNEIMIEDVELNILLQEPHASNVLFNAPPGKLAEPVFKSIKSLRLKDKIEGASVIITLNGSTEVKLSDCKISKVTLDPQIGGLTCVSLQVQCTPKLDSLIARLLEKLNCEATVEILAEGFGEQKALPLDPPSTDDDETDAKIRSGLHRAIASHSAKKGRKRNMNA